MGTECSAEVRHIRALLIKYPLIVSLIKINTGCLKEEKHLKVARGRFYASASFVRHASRALSPLRCVAVSVADASSFASPPTTAL